MRVLVCGGRSYKDYDTVCMVLYKLCDEFNLWDSNKTLPCGLVIIHGGAKGADSLADMYFISDLEFSL